jgi:hypothetical protein
MADATPHRAGPVIAQWKSCASRCHSKFNFGMFTTEVGEARNQPIQGKCRCDPGNKHRTRPHRGNLIGKPLNAVESVREPGVERTTLVREFKSIGVTLKKSEPKTLL